MNPIHLSLLVSLTFSTLFAADAKPDAPKPPRAARSVHLGYSLPDGKNGKTSEVELAYNEIVVEQSTSNTYFCALGFQGGYFGMQELGQGKKIVIFSVWDPGKQNDPKVVVDDQKVQVLYEGEGVKVSRFGGEGTGGKSVFPYDWKAQEPQRFLLKAESDGASSTFTGYFYLSEKKEWKKLATFKTSARKTLLRGLYSFIEDFRRDVKSIEEPRRANFGNGWVKAHGCEWLQLTHARFTGDPTPLENNDAGAAKNDPNCFYLTTGGDAKRTRALNSMVELKPENATLPFDRIPMPQD